MPFESGDDHFDQGEGLAVILGLISADGLAVFRGRVHAHLLHAAQRQAELALADEEIQGLPGGRYADDLHGALLAVVRDNDILGAGRGSQQESGSDGKKELLDCEGGT